MTKKQVIIEQYIGNDWVELVAIPTEDGASFKDAVTTIAELTEKLSKGGSLYMTLETGYSIIITVVNGPIRLELK